MGNSKATIRWKAAVVTAAPLAAAVMLATGKEGHPALKWGVVAVCGLTSAMALWTFVNPPTILEVKPS